MGSLPSLGVSQLTVVATPRRQVSVEDWAGASPGWTGGLSSVEFVRRQRDEDACEDGE